MKYNIGCGKDLKEDCINVDIRDIDGAKQGDIKNPEEIINEYGPANCVLMYDVLEHLNWNIADDVLRKWCQVIEPDGIIIVQVPNFEELIRILKEDDKPLARQRALIFGRQDYPENTHKTFYTTDHLVDILESENFEITDTKSERNIFVKAKKIGENNK